MEVEWMTTKENDFFAAAAVVKRFSLELDAIFQSR